MNSKVRDVEDRDWPAICQLGHEFYVEGKLPGQFVPAIFEKNWRSWLNIEIGVLLVLDCEGEVGGVIGALVSEDPCDGTKVAQEMFWFVGRQSRGHGLKLIDALELTLIGMGVRRLTMAHLSSLRAKPLAALFARKGFRPVETHYVKELPE